MVVMEIEHFEIEDPPAGTAIPARPEGERPSLPPRKPRRFPIVPVAILLVLLLAGIGAGLYWARSRGPEPVKKIDNSALLAPSTVKIARITVKCTEATDFTGSYSDFESSTSIQGTTPAQYEIENPKDFVFAAVVKSTENDAPLIVQIELDGKVVKTGSTIDYRGIVQLQQPL